MQSMRREQLYTRMCGFSALQASLFCSAMIHPPSPVCSDRACNDADSELLSELKHPRPRDQYASCTPSPFTPAMAADQPFSHLLVTTLFSDGLHVAGGGVRMFARSTKTAEEVREWRRAITNAGVCSSPKHVAGTSTHHLLLF